MKIRYLVLKVVIMLLFSGVSSLAWASHLKISNVSTAQIKNSHAYIQCDVSWDEAWKDDLNLDGVWLFAKYRLGSGLWKHIDLNKMSKVDFDGNNRVPENFSRGLSGQSKRVGIWVPQTKKGFFLYKTEKGIENIRLEKIEFGWDYQKAGLKKEEVQKAEIKVFAVEMVYVPEASHYVGDPQGKEGPLNCLYTYPDGGVYLIQSEDELIVDARAGYLYCDQDNERGRDAAPFTILKNFPKGYKAFWYMKYELSTQQYVDFLNTLTRKQQQSRTMTDISSDIINNYHVMTDTQEEDRRQSIVCSQKGNGTEEPVTFYTYAPARACNVLCWGDVAAYADWAGLRPVTELEYEKACRGSGKAVAWECAWGSLEIGRTDTFAGCDGSGYEKKIPQTGIVNCCFGGGIAPFMVGKQEKPDNPGFEGPVSCGLFANSRHEGIPKRLNDGASYYGIMELSGNLWEPCVTFGHPKGRVFTGEHGDGDIDVAGYANVSAWPDASGAGAGVRGGVWVSPKAMYVAVALRFAGAHTKSKRRYNGGCRVGF